MCVCVLISVLLTGQNRDMAPFAYKRQETVASLPPHARKTTNFKEISGRCNSTHKMPFTVLGVNGAANMTFHLA